MGFVKGLHSRESQVSTQLVGDLDFFSSVFGFSDFLHCRLGNLGFFIGGVS